MHGEETLKEIYSSVIRTEETVKGLKEAMTLQRQKCESHEKRITNLEICGGRTKGIFATVSAAIVILVTAIVILITQILGK